jgi:hypothetical protein
MQPISGNPGRELCHPCGSGWLHPGIPLKRPPSPSLFDFYYTPLERRIQTKLDEWILCECCWRHGGQKPGIWKPWVETSHKPGSNEPLCECACRHYARALCRLHPDSEYCPSNPIEHQQALDEFLNMVPVKDEMDLDQTQAEYAAELLKQSGTWG